MTDDVDEKTIHLPQPAGHRRGCLRYRNGLTQETDMTPEELADVVEEFLADPERRRLDLRDARYGDLYVVQRHALEEELLDILVAYVANPAPQTGRRASGVTVAREMPVDPALVHAAELEAGIRRRRLN